MAASHAKRFCCGFAAALLIWGTSSARVFSASFFPMLANGPSSNRVNVAFLSEGYTSNQVTKFLGDCTNALNGLLSRSPFQEYKTHLNAGAIWVASPQAGSDHPAYSVTRNTYFDSTYDAASDYIITIPSGAQGQGKADALLATHMPDYDLAVLLVNDVVFGGSDGNGRMAIASTAPASAVIVAHEAGHVLGRLGDEYERPYPGFPDTEFPNTTRETRRDFISWKAWIEQATPIPTPETFDFYDTVGLFEGAHYHQTGWFRPKLDCAMNSLQPPFCEVCREALVLAFYQRCRPVEGFAPANTNLVFQHATPTQFNVTVLQPVAAPLRIDWVVNGATVSSGTATQFVCEPTMLRAGNNTVTARVQDETPFVRTDPTGLMQQSIAWNIVTESLTPLSLDAPHVSGPGKFVFRINGSAAAPVKVQASTNLVNWNNVSTNNLIPSGTWVTNDALNAQQVFYRVAK